MLIIQKTAKEPLLIDIIDDYNTKNNNIKVKPFLKWAGGKSQMLPEIEKYYPFSNGTINKYAEPFVGGGAILFDILNKYHLKEIYISDINAELINTYHIIRDNIDSMIRILSMLQDEFIPMDTDNRKAYYLKKRERFNELKVSGDKNINIEKAALMIYLNKTCFNGLYRVNKNGEFNVPCGKYKNPTICDFSNLRNLSFLIRNVNFQYGDYTKSEKYIDNNTFVYFDPPYRPLSITSGFTSYTKEDFNDENQKELANFFRRLDKKEAKLMLSNSNPKNTNKDDVFFENIYKGFNINEISAKRMINSNVKR